MSDFGSFLASLAALFGAGATSVITEIDLFSDALVGFGLGGVVGSAIVVARERTGKPVRASYTIGLWSLVGCLGAILLYLIVEVS